MTAELAVVETRKARWRFAVSCVRVVVGDPKSRVGVGLFATVTAMLVASLVAATTIHNPSVRAESIALVVALSLSVAAAGRIGPVGSGRTPRAIRSAAHLLVSALAFSLVYGLRDSNDPGSGVKAGGTAVIFGVLLAILVSLQIVTARRSRVVPVALACGACSGLLFGGGWYLVVMLSGQYHRPFGLALGSLTVLLLAGAAAAMSAAYGGENAEQRARAGAIAGIIATALVAIAPIATYALLPGTVPDPSPGSYAPQLNRADHDAQDAAEVADPYVAVGLLGGLLASATIVVAAGRLRPRTSLRPIDEGRPAASSL